MNLPDRIFAVGGAGKAIALQLLDADWVLEEVLRPRPNPRSVTVTILDTAEGEENEDRQRIQEMRQRIAEKENELRDAQEGRTGTIDLEYKLITNDIQLSGQIDLLGDDTVPRIAAGNGMDEDDWWLCGQHINENLDFAKGVVRKRGLGKAIYYKAYAEDDQMSTYVDLPDKGKVAVIAGLGGGTGSGIFLDVVQHLQQKQRTAEITLFGILPNHTEGLEENTNAFAALSELEYLSLQGENLFKDRILLPIDPTGFDGKTGNRIHTAQYLEELDEAAIYLIASYYNTQNLEDPFVGTPSYAPFTIGVPQILRYNVEAINEARDSLREILDEKEEALSAEEEIYSEIDRFFSRHYEVESSADGELRDMDKTDLRERFESVEELIDFDLFNELDYQSLTIFRDILRDARDEGEEITEQIDIAAGSLRAGTHRSGANQAFVDDIDELLGEILEGNIKRLAHRKELLERKAVIEDSQVRKTVEHLLFVGDDSLNPGVQLNRLEGKLEDVRERRERLGENLEDAVEELEELRESRAAEIERKRSDWESAVQHDLRQYERLTELSVRSQINTLEGELDAFRSEIVNADDEDAVEAASAANINETLDSLSAELDEVGIDFEQHRQAVKGSLPALRRAKQAYLRMNKEEGTVEKFTPWTSSTEEDRKEAQKDYRMQKNELNDKEVFSVGPPGTSFSAEVTFGADDVEQQVERRKQDLRASIGEELHSRMDTPDAQYVEELERALDRGAEMTRLAEIAEEAFRAGDDGTAAVEERKAELEEELADVENRVDIYEATSDLFQQLNNLRSTYEQKQASFNSQRGSYDEESTRSVSTEEEEYVYVKNIKPNDVLRTTGDSNIRDSDLFKSREETQRLRANLEELARNARNQQYTGLKRRKFSRGRQRYDDLKIRVAMMSQAIDQIDSEALDFTETFSGSFDLGGGGKRVESPYTTWQRDIGDNWDIGMCVFIDGVFLDNIRKAVDADGYFSGYREQHAALDDDIVVHHSYGLERGVYVRRNDVLNMENEDDVGFYLRPETEVVDDLLDEHFERVDQGADDAIERESVVGDAGN
jgi:hypothetical protein